MNMLRTLMVTIFLMCAYFMSEFAIPGTNSSSTVDIFSLQSVNCTEKINTFINSDSLTQNILFVADSVAKEPRQQSVLLSSDPIILEHLIGRINSSGLHSMAVQMLAKDNNSFYLDLINSNAKHSHILRKMLRDYTEKWQNGDEESIKKLFAYMCRGATQQGDLEFGADISRVNYKLFGFHLYEHPYL